MVMLLAKNVLVEMGTMKGTGLSSVWAQYGSLLIGPRGEIIHP